jgi:pseudaminic acid biosynthesis-associated methylase
MNTEQVDFWTGEFGKSYMERNKADQEMLSSRLMLWSTIFRTLAGHDISSILEMGSNIGINLRALRLITQAELYAVEPYKEALDVCVADSIVKKENAFNDNAFNTSTFSDSSIDFVFTSGVLIHIHPDDLKRATDNIVRIAKKYIVCVEYFSDKEEEIVYRGQRNKLFKRDFGSFYMENYPFKILLDIANRLRCIGLFQ